MSIQTKVFCDLTNKEIKREDLNRATVCNVVYPVVGTVKSYDGKTEHEAITNVERYEFHISQDKAKAFMIGLQKLVRELQEK